MPLDIKPYHRDVQIHFQLSHKRSITAPKTSLSSPPAVSRTAMQQPSHTSPQDPLDSSRPNNNYHQKPPLSSHKSSVTSSQQSSTKISSSLSSSPKPIPWSSLKRPSDSTSAGLKAVASGKNRPIQVEKSTVSSHKLASNGMTLPPKMRSGRTVRLPGRYRD